MGRGVTLRLDPARLAVVEAMRIAPSVYNRQPWRFRPRGDDTLRIEWSLDPPDASICIGCALEAAAHVAHIEVAPVPGEACCDVRIEGIRDDFQRRAGTVRTRVTHRAPLFQTPPPPAAIDAVVAAANAHGIGAHPLLNRASISEVAEITAEATTEVFSTQPFMAERLEWLRPTSAGRDVPDGLAADAMGFGPALGWALEGMRRGGPGARSIGARAGVPAAMGRSTRRGVEASGLLIALVDEERSSGGRLVAGRAMMAAWLAAVRAGLAAQPISDALPFPDRVAELRSLFGVAGAGVPFVVLRLGYAARPAPRSGRRPLDKVLLA